MSLEDRLKMTARWAIIGAVVGYYSAVIAGGGIDLLYHTKKERIKARIRAVRDAINGIDDIEWRQGVYAKNNSARYKDADERTGELYGFDAADEVTRIAESRWNRN